MLVDADAEVAAPVVDLVIDAPAWDEVGLAGLAERAARAVLDRLGLDGPVELALLATDDRRIAELNASFRDRDAATNVLSWPAQDLAAEDPGGDPDLPEADFPDEPLFLGDVALAWESCRAEAEVGGKPLADHVTHLIVHGILHLLGYDHVREADAGLMERLEVEILAELGLPDPY